MSRFLQITLIVIVVILALLIIIPSIMLKYKPSMEELMSQSTLAPSDISLTAQDLYDRVQALLPYPQEASEEDETTSDQMQIYANGDLEGEDPVDTLTVALLETGVQYEYYDSGANILYRSLVSLDATPEHVTAADFSTAGITAIDMTKLQELTS